MERTNPFPTEFRNMVRMNGNMAKVWQRIDSSAAPQNDIRVDCTVFLNVLFRAAAEQSVIQNRMACAQPVAVADRRYRQMTKRCK